jgi:hypothetical protein
MPTTPHRRKFPCHEKFTDASDVVAGFNECGNELAGSIKLTSSSPFLFVVLYCRW